MEGTERDPLTAQIIGGAIEVHKALGPGLLESAYEACLCHELCSRGLSVQRQVEVPVIYRGVRIDCGYRMDLLVNAEVIVELKAIEKLLPIHEAQLLTYMKLANIRRGLMFNFHMPVLKDGIIRRVL